MSVRYAASSIAAGGFGLPWGHTRTYTNQLFVGNTRQVHDFGQGYNRVVEQWGYVAVDPDGVTYSVVRGTNVVLSEGGQYTIRPCTAATTCIN